MSYELHVLRAAADGVQPAVLLRAPGKKAEYLFNVPDGFSRLAMERKLTPSARLSCVLLTCLLPPSTGGLGGLLLRLKHDGHGQVQLIGPQGSLSITHSLRHICRWQHPKVFVSECYDGGSIPVFEDEHVVIVPLLAGDQSTGCPWCLYASSESPVASVPAKAPPATTSDSSSSDSSGSDSSISSDDAASPEFAQPSSDVEGEEFEKSLSAFIPSSELGNGFHSNEDFVTSGELNRQAGNGATADDIPHFCHTQTEGRELSECPSVVPRLGKRDVDHQPLLDIDEGFSGRVQLKKAKSGSVSSASNAGPIPNLGLQHDDCGRGSLKEMTSESGNLMSNHRKDSRMIDSAEVLPASASGAGLSNSAVVQPTKPYEWLVSNLHQDDLPQLADDSNPVYGRRSSTTQTEAISGVEIEKIPKRKEERNSARVLGYVSYLRKVNSAVLFVDCRSIKDLESLRTHPALNCKCLSSGSIEDDETNASSKLHSVSASVHLTPHSVAESCDYQSWMSSIRSPFHVVMNERSPEFGFQSSLAVLQRLNNIHHDIFPLPFHMDPNSRTTQLTEQSTNSNATVVDAKLSTCLRFCEDGTTTLSDASVDPSRFSLSSEKISSLAAETSEQTRELLFAKVKVPESKASACSYLSPNALAANGIKRRLLQQKETCSLTASSSLSHGEDEMCEDVDRALNVDNEEATPVVVIDEQPTNRTPVQEYVKCHDPSSDFQLIFLGTGCAEPSRNRGSSSILLQVRGARGAMLLDAGEGAAGQLFRRFGEHGARTIISSLRCLWLSHKHGDHVLGVLSILQTRSSRAPPLVIIGPHKVHQWLSEARDTCAARGYPVPQFTYIHCDELSHSEHYKSNPQHAQLLLEVLDAMQLKSMLAVKVFHCYDAYAIILDGRRGWKVVYSGDTRPCRQLMEAGQGCTLLIHEATFEDTLVEQAKGKRHSTVSEAVTVGWQMRARHVILTHFSQRYPEMVAIQGEKKGNLSVAFDGMVVPSRLLELLGQLLPQIRIACQKTVSVPPITITGEQRSEGTSKPMPIWPCESAVLQHSGKDSSAAKHKRWSSDSDDEATDQCPHSDAITTSLRWSSDCDEEDAEFSEQEGSLAKNGSRDPPAESCPNHGACNLGCAATIDPFGGIASRSPKKKVDDLERNTQVRWLSSNTRESAGPLGGKHLRWIDSDSEDG